MGSSQQSSSITQAAASFLLADAALVLTLLTLIAPHRERNSLLSVVYFLTHRLACLTCNRQAGTATISHLETPAAAAACAGYPRYLLSHLALWTPSHARDTAASASIPHPCWLYRWLAASYWFPYHTKATFAIYSAVVVLSTPPGRDRVICAVSLRCGGTSIVGCKQYHCGLP